MIAFLRARYLLPLLGLTACFDAVPEPGVLGPSGGELMVDRVRLIVPPGALTTATRLTIAADSSTPPAGWRAVGGTVRLGPEGTQFNQPITLELPLFEDTLTAPRSVQIATAPTGTQNFELLPVEGSGILRVRTQISHFSIFIPVEPDESDAGIADGGTGLDGGFTGDPLEDCQTDYDAVTWWTLPFDDAGVAAIELNGGETGLTELPAVWVFTIGPNVYTVDRATRRLVNVRHTMSDTPLGGGVRLAALRFPSELLFVSGRGSMYTYTEWRTDLSGSFTAFGDGGMFRQVEGSGANPLSGGFDGPGPGVSVIPNWDAVAVSAGPWPPTSLMIVPRDPAQQSRSFPLPVSVTESTSAVQTSDGRVLVGLNTWSPSPPANPTSIHTEIYELSLDGGLSPLGWSVEQNPRGRGLALASGGDAGVFVLNFRLQSVEVTERAAASPSWVGAFSDGGSMWPIPGPVQRTPSGLSLFLVAGGQALSRYGRNATPMDIHLLTYPRGRLTRLFEGQRSFAAAGIGAVRDDSFIYAFYEEGVGIRAARLCLPQ